jgi:hypothetical protein
MLQNARVGSVARARHSALRGGALGVILFALSCGRIDLGSHDAGVGTGDFVYAAGASAPDAGEQGRPELSAMRRLIEPETCAATFNRCSEESGLQYCWPGFRGFESGTHEGSAPASGGALFAPTALEASGTWAQSGAYSLRLGVALPAGAGLRTGFFVSLCDLGDEAGDLAGQLVSFSVFPGALLGPDSAPVPAGTFVEVLRVFASTRPDGLVGRSAPLSSGVWNEVSLVIPADALDEPLVGLEVHVVFGSSPYTGELFFDDLLLGGD